MVDKPENDFDANLENLDNDIVDIEEKPNSNNAEARRRIEDLKDQKALNELLSDDDYWDL